MSGLLAVDSTYHFFPAQLSNDHSSFRPMMRGFLMSAKLALQQQSGSRVPSSAPLASNPFLPLIVFVLGNEGGDMDSTIGALYLGYTLQQAWSQRLVTPAATSVFAAPAARFIDRLLADNGPTRPVVFVPLCNYAMEDLPLRQDIGQALAAAVADDEDTAAVPAASLANEFIFLTDDDSTLEFYSRATDGDDTSAVTSTSTSGVPRLVRLPLSPFFTAAAAPHSTPKIVLVDHNRLCERQAWLQPHIVGVIDHHVDEGQYPQDIALRDIRVVGSACSLVTLIARQVQEATLTTSAAAAGAAALPHPLLLTSTILLDTGNFNPDDKKTTDTDLQAYAWLANEADGAQDAGSQSARVHRAAGRALGRLPSDPKLMKHWYKSLREARRDVTSLSPAQQLRRDYKRNTMAITDVMARFLFDSSLTVPPLARSSTSLSIGVAAWVELWDTVMQRLEPEGGIVALEQACLAHCKRGATPLDAIMIMFSGHKDDATAGNVQLRELLIVVPRALCEVDGTGGDESSPRDTTEWRMFTELCRFATQQRCPPGATTDAPPPPLLFSSTMTWGFPANASRYVPRTLDATESTGGGSATVTGSYMALFHQLDNAVSRKLFAPMLAKYLSTAAPSSPTTAEAEKKSSSL